MIRPARKAIPLGVQNAVLMRELGLTRDQFEFDHDPPLGLRPVDPKTGDLHPPQNDPDYIFVRRIEPHRAKTAEDVARIAKAKRQGNETGQVARRERNGPTMPSKRWKDEGTGYIPSRPMQKPADVGRRHNWKTGRMEDAS